MINEEYQRNLLPTLSETFPQFSRPLPLPLSLPLDLSQRVSNVVPITPPSTPSPPKRHRLMSEENQLWRPLPLRAPSNLYLDVAPSIILPSPCTINSTSMVTTATTDLSSGGNYFDNVTYASRQIVAQCSKAADYRNNLQYMKNNFSEIPVTQPIGKQQQAQRRQYELPVIYVDDETIILTEDDDETVVSSHECTENAVDEVENRKVTTDIVEKLDKNNKYNKDVNVEDDDEEYVDVLGNDDEYADNFLSMKLQQQNQLLDEELEKSGKVLTRNKLVYENEILHNEAINGLDRLFERSFTTNKNYEEKQKFETPTELASKEKRPTASDYLQNTSLAYNINSNNRNNQKPERKRVKLRKHPCVDEETISPVSGTIIRKLRDDEELVVRKGDIDPAFNVVEITEEAKAILASIDNKIGDYLCQLCRTLYDDAFMLAQHRCPRIVHIEYKCSECEKVFNCPANLASHRRWHKPRTELVTNQTKKRQINEQTGEGGHLMPDYSLSDDGTDGTYVCTQCNKVFRRQAYLKKHQASHQVMDSISPLNLFKKSTNTNILPNFVAAEPSYDFSAASNQQTAMESHQVYQNHYPYAKKYFTKQMENFSLPNFDQQRFYTLGQLYFSQQLERSSAFQYVPLRTANSETVPIMPVK